MNHNMLQNPTVRYAVAVSTAAAFVVCAEMGPKEEISETAHTTQSAAIKIIEELPADELTNSDEPLCTRPGSDFPDKEYQAAERCQRSYKDRNFALVDFTSLSEYTMKEIADDTAIGLRNATAGIVTSTVKVVDPPKAIAREWKEARRGSCIDHNDPATYASTFAKEHLPELEKYDHVMAVTDIPACNRVVGGVAASVPGHVADIFNAANVYKKDGVIQLKKVAIHEGGHDIGLDHYSAAGGCKDPMDETVNKAYVPPIDLGAYLKSCQHIEYFEQSSNIMGSATGDIANLQPNPIQRQDLLWPEKILRGEIQVPGKKIDTTTGLIFSTQGIHKHHQYGIIDLAEAAVIYDGDKNAHIFSQISFVPEVIPRGKSNDVAVSYVRMYLSNQNGGHIYLGPVLKANSEGLSTRFISHGNQVIEVSAKSDQVIMRQTVSK